MEHTFGIYIFIDILLIVLLLAAIPFALGTVAITTFMVLAVIWIIIWTISSIFITIKYNLLNKKEQKDKISI